MSTTFKTATLIIAAQVAVDLHNAAHVEYQEAVRKYKQVHLEQWQANTRPRLVAARDALTKLLRSGAPITRELYRDTVSNSYVGISELFYHEPDKYQVESKVGKPGWGYYINVATWNGLIALLKARKEPEITDYQLARLGYPKINVLFEAAGRSGLELV